MESARGGSPGRSTVARGSNVGQSSGTRARAWIERQEATTRAGTGASRTGANASGGAGSIPEAPGDAPAALRATTAKSTGTGSKVAGARTSKRTTNAYVLALSSGPWDSLAAGFIFASVWASLWGSLTTKRAVFSLPKRKTQAREREPKAAD